MNVPFKDLPKLLKLPEELLEVELAEDLIELNTLDAIDLMDEKAFDAALFITEKAFDATVFIVEKTLVTTVLTVVNAPCIEEASWEQFDLVEPINDDTDEEKVLVELVVVFKVLDILSMFACSCANSVLTLSIACGCCSICVTTF